MHAMKQTDINENQALARSTKRSNKHTHEPKRNEFDERNTKNVKKESQKCEPFRSICRNPRATRAIFGAKAPEERVYVYPPKFCKLKERKSVRIWTYREFTADSKIQSFDWKIFGVQFSQWFSRVSL